MYTTLITLIDRLEGSTLSRSNVIQWGSPVPSFGDLSSSRVATLGLNPSNREFMDESGNELQGEARRFHTLNSLGLTSWSNADARHLRMIVRSCRTYFLGNPYDRWFKRLDPILSGMDASYYDESNKACHLDLIPYATACKWTELDSQQRSSLMTVAADTLGLLLRDSPVQILILNGRSVVNRFQECAGIFLESSEKPAWSLPRRSGDGVVGIAYWGEVEVIHGINLGRKVLVLGFNHNIQSSFGVTRRVILDIRNWISRKARETIQ